jgi:hypothetical protein
MIDIDQNAVGPQSWVVVKGKGLSRCCQTDQVYSSAKQI